jgi:hypothetical protein
MEAACCSETCRALTFRREAERPQPVGLLVLVLGAAPRVVGYVQEGGRFSGHWPAAGPLPPHPRTRFRGGYHGGVGVQSRFASSGPHAARLGGRRGCHCPATNRAPARNSRALGPSGRPSPATDGGSWDFRCTISGGCRHGFHAGELRGADGGWASLALVHRQQHVVRHGAASQLYWALGPPARRGWGWGATAAPCALLLIASLSPTEAAWVRP